MAASSILPLGEKAYRMGEVHEPGLKRFHFRHERLVFGVGARGLQVPAAFEPFFQDAIEGF
jgi:hypothetical protein